MEITEGTFNAMKVLKRKGKEGLVLLGAGGDPNEWIEGISKILIDEKIARADFLVEAVSLTTSGGRHDLVLMFDHDKIDIGKLAIWRLQFGDNSWLSDYVVNYADHHAA